MKRIRSVISSSFFFAADIANIRHIILYILIIITVATNISINLLFFKIMLIFNLFSNPILAIGFIAGILLAVTVHEFMHAYVAFKLGDATAKLEGRVSLNPFVHLDLFGTIMLLLAGFGWGKPVPINPANFRHKYDEIKVSFAGIVGNLIIAILLALIIRIIPMPLAVAQVIVIIIEINITLMVFNLIPIPPLDGAAIFKAILPDSAYATMQSLSTPLFIAFIFFIYTTPYISNFIHWLTTALLNLLVG